MSAHQWSTTALANQTADARAQFQEGQAASSLNNGCRGMMASAALWRDDHLGTLVATVSSTNVFTVNTNEGLIDPASIAGGGTAKITKPFIIRVVLPAMPTAVATSAPTIVIDGAAAVPLLRSNGSALADGDLTGIPNEILGDAITAGAYSRARVLDTLPSQYAPSGPAGLPIGAMIDWPSTVTPDGYLDTVGALVKRTDYAALWTFAQASGMLLSEAAWASSPGSFSVGDSSTTFRIPLLGGDFIRVLDGGRGVDANRVLGSLQADAFKAHNHPPANSGAYITGYGSGSGSANVASGSLLQIDSSANVGGAETRPRNTAYRKLIKYK